MATPTTRPGRSTRHHREPLLHTGHYSSRSSARRPWSMAGGAGWIHPYRSRRAVVVVVGGGVAGALIANSLQSYADVVIIDPKEYLEIPWTNMRSKVEPSVAEKSLINHSDYLSGQVITASAADISGEAVIRTEGRLVEYTYLVIAAGHTNQCPRNRRD
ncbi:uncharacterized protein [Triticum aestivum]|uniref:uncharacterized protein n=1 Tax=Triticum aestivum TaxID=4565 RepID=UPI001D010BE8|nr:uncharacterized protein LOC123062704 [Triticum aestivum]